MTQKQDKSSDSIDIAFARLRTGLYALGGLLLIICSVTAALYLKKAEPTQVIDLATLLDKYQQSRMFGKKEAAKYLQSIKEQEPQLAELIAKMAAYDEKGPKAFTKVLEAAKEVLKVRADYAEAHGIIAAHYLRRKKPEKAREYIEAGLKSYPTSPALITERAMYTLQTKPNSPAILSDFRAALKIHPTYRPALSGYLQLCALKGKHQELIEYFKGRLRKKPDDFQSIANLSIALRGANQKKDALLLLREELTKKDKTALAKAKRQRYLRPRLLHQLMKMNEWTEVLQLSNEIIASMKDVCPNALMSKERALEALACLRYIKQEESLCPRESYSSLMTRSLKLDQLRRKHHLHYSQNKQKE